jgi:transposase
MRQRAGAADHDRWLCDQSPQRRRYASDLSDTAWARIAGFIVPNHPRRGRPCPPQRWLQYVDAIPYVLRTGCAWRHLPHDFTVNCSAAHKHLLRWCRAGIWAKVHTAIRGEARTRSARRRRPSAAVIDSSSVKASPIAGPRGFDGAKKVDGITRHILIDSAGILIAALVTAANVQHRASFPKLMRKTKRIAPGIAHIWLDKGYTAQTVADAAARVGVNVEIVSGPKPGHGFTAQPRRWVIERTNG